MTNKQTGEMPFANRYHAAPDPLSSLFVVFDKVTANSVCRGEKHACEMIAAALNRYVSTHVMVPRDALEKLVAEAFLEGVQSGRDDCRKPTGIGGVVWCESDAYKSVRTALAEGKV